MKDGIIIQARTGSTRLHNKILLPFYGEQRIIDILIANIKQACPDKCIVLATTNRPQDDVLAETARQAGILSFRGDEDNVLDRFIRAAEVFGINRFIRVCSDNPFLRPETFNTFFAEHNFCPADYIAYGFADGRPTIKSHLGLYSELTTIDALRRAAGVGHDTRPREEEKRLARNGQREAAAGLHAQRRRAHHLKIGGRRAVDLVDHLLLEEYRLSLIHI